MAFLLGNVGLVTWVVQGFEAAGKKLLLAKCP